MNPTNILIYFLLTIHVIVCLLLILIVLMQRPKSEGLGTTFGGGVTDTLFGTGAGNVLTKITTWLGTIFFITTMVLAYLYSHRDQSGSLRSKINAAPSVTETNAAPTPSPVPVVPSTGTSTNKTSK